MSCPILEFLEIQGPCVPDPIKVFPHPALLSQLRTLRLQDIEFVKPSLLGVDWHDLTFYLALTSVQHLQLINTPLEPLFPKQDAKRKRLLRSRSLEPRARAFSDNDNVMPPPVRVNEFEHRIPKGELLKLGPFPSDSENPSLNPRLTASSRTHWPNLNTITLDTTHARDVGCLCKLIAERPEIKAVYLSPSAKRLLASSVTVRRGDQTDRVSSHWDLNLKKKNWVRKDRIDPVAWLEQCVEVREYHAKKETFH
ncbi:hypothetical protein C8R42DRAFT_721954 [Lentinula raphanica]|nr:hypothetical protein C8R42DRAFT_721954 [Lentinula raphanica]